MISASTYWIGVHSTRAFACVEQSLVSPADSDLGSVISDRLLSPGRRLRPKLLRRDSSIGLQSVLSIAADEVHKCAVHAYVAYVCSGLKHTPAGLGNH